MSMVNDVSVDDQTRAIEQHWAYWSAHDMDRLLSLFTHDAVYEDVTMGAVNRGPAQLRAFGEGFFGGFPDVTFELKSSFANGSSGGAECRTADCRGKRIRRLSGGHRRLRGRRDGHGAGN